jgi:GNAT superfamily N-acetyltransferase
MTFEVTPAQPTDVPAILALIRELAEYEKLLDQVHATEESLRRDLFGSRAYAEVLVARIESTVIAYALFFHSYSTFLAKPGIYLEDLYVQPQFRGRGTGRALLRAIAQIAKERDCGRLEFAVLDWNEPSIGFYKGLGAVPLEDWTTYRLAEREIAELAGGSARAITGGA